MLQQRDRLDNVQFMSVIYDGWDAPAKQGKVLGIIGCHVMKDWTVKQELLGLKVCESNLTSPFLYSLISGCLNSWTSKDKVKISALVSDTCNNVKAAGHLFQNTEWFSCICHQIQLAVKDFIRANQEDIDTIINKVSDTVVYIRNNLQHRTEIKKRQKGEPLSLIARNDTRWNSVYLMLERFVTLAPVIKDVLGSQMDISEDDLQTVSLFQVK
jgi:hypothetical protein